MSDELERLRDSLAASRNVVREITAERDAWERRYDELAALMHRKLDEVRAALSKTEEE